MKKESGITLIALVVTIVVLLILAGVTLNMVLGNNGIITKATEARDKTINSQIYAEVQINELYTQMLNAQTSNGSGGDIGESTSKKLLPGNYVTYKNEEWQVLYNDTKGIQIVKSTSADRVSILGKLEYNNAINILNDACKTYEDSTYTITGKARCIGSNPTNPADTTTETLIAYILGNPVDTGAYIGDSNYVTDYQTMQRLGILSTGNLYFLASRNAEKWDSNSGSHCNFNIRYIDELGNLNELDGTTYNFPEEEELSIIGSIRPVVSLKDNLKLSSGNGTKSNPYTLAP